MANGGSHNHTWQSISVCQKNELLMSKLPFCNCCDKELLSCCQLSSGFTTRTWSWQDEKETVDLIHQFPANNTLPLGCRSTRHTRATSQASANMTKGIGTLNMIWTCCSHPRSLHGLHGTHTYPYCQPPDKTISRTLSICEEALRLSKTVGSIPVALSWSPNFRSHARSS